MDAEFHRKVKLMFTIVDRKRGEQVVKMYQSEGLFINFLLMGRGTASSDLLDILCLGDTEKYLILTPIREEKIEPVFARLENEMNIAKAGHGIAFTMPISSVGGPNLLKLFSGVIRDMLNQKEKNEGASNE